MIPALAPCPACKSVNGIQAATYQGGVTLACEAFLPVGEPTEENKYLLPRTGHKVSVTRPTLAEALKAWNDLPRCSSHNEPPLT